ncbi:MAG: hypothetical protein JXA43_00755 [Candidatus Diapherotrites archaeon]|nr:hypothetical protein [Candidatus Diapherotrites archaeon]
MWSQDLLFSYEYPFTNEARNTLTSFNLVFENVPKAEIEETKKLVIAIAKKKKIDLTVQENSGDTLKSALVRYTLAKIIIGVSNSEQLKVRFAKEYSDFSYSRLKSEKVIMDLLTDLFDVDSLSFDEKDYLVGIRLEKYLKYPPREKTLELVNRNLKNGYVYLTKQSLPLFLKNVAYWEIYNSFDKDYSKAPHTFREIAKEAKGAIYIPVPKIFLTKGKLTPEKFPPCIRALSKSIAEGNMPGHFGNIALTTFLLGIGAPVDFILETYKQSAKFDPKVATYQIQYLAGKTGSRTGSEKYSAPSCKKMQDWNLCVNRDPLCEKVSHPLSYYSAKIGNFKKKGKADERKVVSKNKV